MKSRLGALQSSLVGISAVIASLLLLLLSASVVLPDEIEKAPRLPRPPKAPSLVALPRTQFMSPRPSVFSSWVVLRGGGSGPFRVVPPDPHGAVGKYGVMTSANKSIAYFSRDGQPRWSQPTVGPAGFFENFGSVGPVYDPRVLYDPSSDRFFFVGLDDHQDSSFVMIAVSRGGDPLLGAGAWRYFRVYITETLDGVKYGGDYPCVAIDGQGLYVSLSMFTSPLRQGSTFKHCAVLAFKKSDLLAGTVTMTRTATADGISAGFTLQPATPVGTTSPGNRLYLAEVPYYDPLHLRVWCLLDPFGIDSLTSATVEIPNNGGGFGGEGAPQFGTTLRLDTVSPRAMSSAFWRDGELWVCCTAGASSSPVRAMVFCYDVVTNAFPAAAPVIQEAHVIDGGAGVWRFLPALALNAAGDVCVTFTQSSSTATPAMLASILSHASGGFSVPVVVDSSATYYNSSDYPGRWGDFAVAAVDPLDGNFWVGHELSDGVSDTNLWHVTWANLRPAISNAGWIHDGLPIRTGYQKVDSPRICGDAAGGAFIAWNDWRAGFAGLYVGHVDAAGRQPEGWPDGGLRVPLLQGAGGGGLGLLEGPAGGFYVLCPGGFGCLLQRVTASGGVAPGWPGTGIEVSGAVDERMVGDGAGGAILGWVDEAQVLRLQRYGPSGAVLWAVGGVDVAAGVDGFDLTGNGTGGAIACTAPAISAQYVSATGSTPWGVSVDLGATGYLPRVVADGSGGAFVAFERDAGGSGTSAYAIRVLSTGTVAQGWPLGGRPCTAINSPQSELAIGSDGASGAIITWRDARADAGDIYGQRLTASGERWPGWPSDGLPICTAIGSQRSPSLTADDAGGALVTWEDPRGIFDMHVLAGGYCDAAFAISGAALCTASGAQTGPCMTQANQGHVMFAWADGRACGSSCVNAIYAETQEIHGVVRVEEPLPPSTSALVQSHPNPFRSGTLLEFALAAPCRVRLEVYDVGGALVRRLVDADYPAGRSVVEWKRDADDGGHVRPGVYLCKFIAGAVSTRRKLIVLQ